LPGVIVDKTVEAFASALFLGSGFFFTLLLLDLPRWMTVAASVCLLVSAAGLALLVIVQRKGVLWALDRVAKIFPRVGRFAAGRERHIRDLDANLRVLHVLGPWTIAATALHFAARVLGVVEVFVIMNVLGAGLSAIQALFTSTGVTLINTAFFLVPGQFGIQESAHVVALQSLGFSAALGLSLGIIRRIRKLATVTVGLILYAAQKPARPKPGVSER